MKNQTHKKLNNMKKLLAMAAVLLAVLTASAQDEKKAVFVEQFRNNAGYNNITVNNLRQAIISGIMDTERLTVVDATTLPDLPKARNERLQALGEKGFDYLLEGTLNSITESHSTKDGKTSYKAEVNYTLVLIDTSTGVTEASETYKDSWSIGETAEEAIVKSIGSAQDRMKKFVDEFFRVQGTIKALDVVDSKKGVKTCYITVGAGMGIQSGQIFEVYAQVDVAGEKVNKKVGELKIKAVMSGTLSHCDVKNGGLDIKKAFDAGTPMKVISRPKKSLLDSATKGLDKILQ